MRTPQGVFSVRWGKNITHTLSKKTSLIILRQKLKKLLAFQKRYTLHIDNPKESNLLWVHILRWKAWGCPQTWGTHPPPAEISSIGWSLIKQMVTNSFILYKTWRIGGASSCYFFASNLASSSRLTARKSYLWGQLVGIFIVIKLQKCTERRCPCGLSEARQGFGVHYCQCTNERRSHVWLRPKRPAGPFESLFLIVSS